MSGLVKRIRKAVEKRSAHRRELVTVRQQRRQVRDMPAEHRLAVCAIVRDEGTYLREWLDFHLLAGVDHFYIYDNGSEDETAAILAEYAHRGVLEVQAWPSFAEGWNPQFSAYAHCTQLAARRTEWVAFIDADEFLFTESGTDLYTALTRITGRDTAMVVVGRYEYGTSGHRDRPAGLVIENYTLRVPVRAHTKVKVKSIVRPERVVSIASAHFIDTRDGDVIDSAGRSVSSKRGRGEGAVAGDLRVNHYFTKSHEEFRAKLARGRMTDKPRWPAKALAKIEELERTAVFADTAAARFAPALRASTSAVDAREAF